MKYILKNQVINVLISCSLLFVSNAANADNEPPSDLKLHGSDCISIRTIRDYTPLSRDSLLIHTSGKRNYYVRLLMPQFGARSAFQIATRSRDDRLCPYGGDSLIFGSFSGDESRIQSISRLTAEQLQQVLVHYGKIEPADKPDPAPPEVSGAEVEELG